MQMNMLTPRQKKAKISKMARDLVDAGDGATARDLLRRGHCENDIEAFGEAAMAEAAKLFVRRAA